MLAPGGGVAVLPLGPMWVLAPTREWLGGLPGPYGDPNEVSDWFWSPVFHRFRIDQPVRIRASMDDGSQRTVDFRLVPRAFAPADLDKPLTGNGQGAVAGYASQALQVEFSSSSDEQRVARMLIDEQGSRQEPPPPQPKMPAYFQSAKGSSLEDDARIFGLLEVRQEPVDIAEVLRILEPRLIRIRTIPGAAGTLIYGDIGIGRMLPLALMGDGLVRVMSHLVRIATARHGVFLVDEVENGLHHAVLEKVWTAIGDAARRFDVQIFATTHSWECIQAAYRSFERSDTYDLRLYRLDRTDGDVRAVAYDEETLAAALNSELEVR